MALPEWYNATPLLKQISHIDSIFLKITTAVCRVMQVGAIAAFQIRQVHVRSFCETLHIMVYNQSNQRIWTHLDTYPMITVTIILYNEMIVAEYCCLFWIPKTCLRHLTLLHEKHISLSDQSLLFLPEMACKAMIYLIFNSVTLAQPACSQHYFSGSRKP